MSLLQLLESEAAAHSHRAFVLSEKLAARTPSSTERVFELCNDFDAAVEFATLVGDSVAEAIATFIEDRWGVAGCSELAGLAGYGSAVADPAVTKLPVLPPQACRLLGTLSQDISPLELGDCAASDPLLRKKLLSAANSPQFGAQIKIVSLKDAVEHMGVPEARKVILTSCAAGLFASKPPKGLWKHSLTVARTASDLLAPLVGVNPETAYVAGLFHDVGRLGFMTLPAELRIREQEWLEAGFPVCYAESLAYGIDHAEFGARILRSWKLPDEIVQAVSLHNRPERSELALNAILSLADSPTPLPPYSAREDLWPGMRRTAAMLKTGITPEQLQELHVGHLSSDPSC